MQRKSRRPDTSFNNSCPQIPALLKAHRLEISVAEPEHPLLGRLRSRFFCWSEPRAGVNSGTSDFRSRPKKWRLYNTAENHLLTWLISARNSSLLWYFRCCTFSLMVCRSIGRLITWVHVQSKLRVQSTKYKIKYL